MENEATKILPLRIFDFFYFGIFKIGRAARHFFRIAWKVVEEKILMRYFMQRIIEVAKQEKAELIHAHTPYRVGLPALKAARKLRLPFVYEMRGMWEETAVANGRWRANGPAYRRFQRFENKVLRAADSVVCISETLKHEAISRGIDATKITVVTNAAQIIDDSDLQKHETFDRVVASLGLKPSTRVIGYIGSLREMEGVDLTAEAVAELMKQDFDVRFFVLSGTAGQEELRNLCDRLELGDSAIITGPVPHQFVPQFYQLIDIFVVSRPDAAVTRLVTPLKPFEAMAMKRAVVTSNLDALQEIVADNETGLLFQAGNLSSLVETIKRLVIDEKLISSLGNNAYDWIIHNRTWELVVKNYAVAYQIAVEKRG